ncbi:FHA domain-containing protein [Rubritalea squalenifaciens DSM 18772]|uniref:FHA domain-containing protein n=1 Tax=Rubritalea squalenifaciens DSM 18772 TaxID=1123071 RepID=A0A1M6GRF1_9BACT|nr:FHA domain-containing protein [Rubritalea squalenifaciens]SHJ12492.1 FHA domain-containing protein [Rubritalea squalenifaciens DSM 18772]
MPRITITEPGRSPQPYRLKLDRESTSIGRASDNDIRIEAGSASTHHCVMKRVSGGFILEDLKSTNGLKVDDTRFSVIDLEDDLTVHIGDDVEFHFTLSDEELEQLSEEDFTPHEKVQFPSSVAAADDEDDDDFEEAPRKKKQPVAEDLDDDDDDFEEAPRKKAQPKKQPAPVAAAPAAAPSYAAAAPKVPTSNPAATLLFLILCIGAVVLGLVVHHYQDTKTFLFAKPAPEAPAKPAEKPAE